MRPRTKNTVLYARKTDVDEALDKPTGNDECTILFARKVPLHYEDFYTIYISNQVVKADKRSNS